MTEIFLGNPPANIVDWIKKHTQPAAAPSPYFAYDSNRVITGLYQGSPNSYVEGTYEDFSGEQKPFSGWTYGGGSNLVENYATAIGDYAFNDGNYTMNSIPPSKGITGNITFQNVTSIGKQVFECCDGLTSVTIPNVTSIGNSAFHMCWELKNVTIGNGIQRIGRNAFSDSTGSITLTIGKTVAEVQAMGTTDYNNSTNVPYSQWGLQSGSTIVCIGGTIPID